MKSRKKWMKAIDISVKATRKAHKKSIILGVTAAESLRLLGDLPLLLVARGWNVLVVCGSGKADYDPWGGQIVIEEIAMERGISPLLDLRALVNWISIIRRNRPSLVSTGTPKAGLLGMISAKLAGVPARIYLLRGLRFETENGPLRRLLILSEWLAATSSTQILSVSESLKELFLKQVRIRRKKVTVLGHGSSHGVCIQTFRPHDRKSRAQSCRELGLDPTKVTLGFVGRFSQDKGSELLLAVAKTLLPQNDQLQLLIVGPIENSRQTLDEIVTSSPTAVVTGFVRDPSVPFGAMDILLLPTKREGFPNVVLEAGASAIPVVTTDATGAVDSVLHGQTGLVVEKNDVAGFVDAVEALAGDAEKRRTFGANAREWVSAHFSQSQVEDNYLRFLSDQTMQRK